MSEFTVTITAKVVCRQCDGQGMIYGSHERGCEACGERGYTVERVTLDAAALIQLGNAIRTVQSAEYAEATRVKVPDTCPECGSTALVLITPLIAGPDGWARRCKACGHRWDVADEA